jgi:hypothetical protein
MLVSPDWCPVDVVVMSGPRRCFCSIFVTTDPVDRGMNLGRLRQDPVDPFCEFVSNDPFDSIRQTLKSKDSPGHVGSFNAC